jgi:hypothetical protein
MLVLDQIGLQRIARLRAAAEAAPMMPFDVLARLRLRQSDREVPDPPAHTVALAEGYLVAFQIEEWPDGRWRRLTISSSGDVWDGLHMLLGEFGFVCGRLHQLRWWGPARGGRRVFTIAELIEARQPPSAPTLDVVDAPIADLEEEDPADEC